MDSVCNFGELKTRVNEWSADDEDVVIIIL